MMNNIKTYQMSYKIIGILSIVYSLFSLVMNYVYSDYLVLWGLTQGWWGFLIIIIGGGLMAYLAYLNNFKKEMAYIIIASCGIILYIVLSLLGFMVQGLIGFIGGVF